MGTYGFYSFFDLLWFGWNIESVVFGFKHGIVGAFLLGTSSIGFFGLFQYLEHFSFILLLCLSLIVILHIKPNMMSLRPLELFVLFETCAATFADTRLKGMGLTAHMLAGRCRT
jgi:hypothetical protein